MAKQKIAPNENVGKNIAALMAASSTLKSQPSLALRTGVAQTTIGRILRNEVSASADTIHKIAQAFDTDVAALFMEHSQFMRLLAQGSRKGQAAPEPARSGVRELVEGVATLARPHRPTLRKTLSNLLVELVEHPDDPDVIEQTITDIERFFGPAT